MWPDLPPWKHAIIFLTWVSNLPSIKAASQTKEQPQIPVEPFHHYDHVHGNQRGAVASENKICTQIGIDLLNAGGNAADAV